MTKFERLSVSGSKEVPDCACGAVMRHARSIQAEKSPDAEVRVYACSACGHEFRLTVWADGAVPAGAVEGL